MSALRVRGAPASQLLPDYDALGRSSHGPSGAASPRGLRARSACVRLPVVNQLGRCVT